MKKELTILILTVALAVPALAQEQAATSSSSPPGFSGPGSTTYQLDEDEAPKEPALRFPAIDRTLQPWFDAKTKLNEATGLRLGLAYPYLHQAASDAPDGAEKDAGSGIFRLSGSWTLLNRDSENTGKLVFSTDHRHRYTDIAPADLGFEAGYLGIPGTLFSDTDMILGDLNWQQVLNDGQSGIVIGRYDPNDFFDVLGYANPWTSFQNLSVLFNASIALPDWSTGIALGHWFTDQWYGFGAINDVNGTAMDIKFFDDFDELYMTAEIGWTPARDLRFLNNVHVMAWHADEREDEGVDEGEGVTIGANWTFDETWMPFVKAGWSDGDAPLYNESVTVGAIYYVARRTDLAGFAVNWGGPVDDSLDDQITSELFYRLQLAQNLAITPSAQLILDPALNPDEDEIWFGGIRARLTL